MHVKKGDTVVVLSGKDRGKQGKIIQALPRNRKVVVEGVHIVKRHQRPRTARATAPGGIVEKPAPLFACKVMLICPKCGKPTRPNKKTLEGGRRARICKRCGGIIDEV